MLRQTVQNQLLQRAPSTAPFIKSRLFKLANGKRTGARAFSTTPGAIASDATAAVKTNPVSNEINALKTNQVANEAANTANVKHQLQEHQPHPRVETSTTQYSMEELFKNDSSNSSSIQNIPQIIRPLLDKNSKGTFHFTEYHSSPTKGTFSKEYTGKYAPDRGLTIKQTHVTHAEANPQITQNGQAALNSDSNHNIAAKDSILQDIEHETQALFDQTRHFDRFHSPFSSLSPFSMGHHDSPFSHPFFTQSFGGIGRSNPLHRLEHRFHNMMSDSENAAEEFGLSHLPNHHSHGSNRNGQNTHFINRPRVENTAAVNESKIVNNAQNAPQPTTGTNPTNMATNNVTSHSNVNINAQQAQDTQKLQQQAHQAQPQHQARQNGPNSQQNGQISNYYDQQRGLTPASYNNWIHDVHDGLNEYNAQLRNLTRMANKARARERKLRQCDPFYDFFEDFGSFGRDPFFNPRHGAGRFWI